MVSREGWEPCPEGLLGEMVERKRVRRRRAALARGALSATALLLVLAAGTAFFSLPPAEHGPLSCAAASQLFAQFHQGRLDPATHQRLEAHLDDCPHCRRRYEQMFARAMPDLSSVPARLRPGRRPPASLFAWR